MGEDGDSVDKWASGLMRCSYNKYNGTWACENGGLMNKMLKEEMGFKGYILSDWNGELRYHGLRQRF